MKGSTKKFSNAKRQCRINSTLPLSRKSRLAPKLIMIVAARVCCASCPGAPWLGVLPGALNQIRQTKIGRCNRHSLRVGARK